MHTFTKSTLHSLARLELESEQLALTVLPEVGAKILTLIDKRTGKNLLWGNPRIWPQKFPIDVNFDNYWCGGWDDAFPTADACEYKGESYPNLGELRSVHWEIDDCGASADQAWVKLSVFAPISPVKAIKTIAVYGDRVATRFELECLGPLPLEFLWGTHPSFPITPETKLIIPGKTGVVSIASHPSLGISGQSYPWPKLGEVDMSRVQRFEAGVHCGHYVTDLEDGWFAVDTQGSGIVFDFPLKECPCLWLWLVYGGWRGYYHAIIEPWTGYPVNLAEAVRQRRHRQFQPGERFAVTVRCATYGTPETYDTALSRLRSSL